MPKDNGNRVLNRVGARQLKDSEIERVTGGKATLASNLGTGPISNPDCVLDQ